MYIYDFDMTVGYDFGVIMGYEHKIGSVVA